eukprot:1942306-Pyramimonas_sp.AAC.1
MFYRGRAAFHRELVRRKTGFSHHVPKVSHQPESSAVRYSALDEVAKSGAVKGWGALNSSVGLKVTPLKCPIGHIPCHGVGPENAPRPTVDF